LKETDQQHYPPVCSFSATPWLNWPESLSWQL